MSSERSDLADAAHVLARLGLVTAFGHVSTRPAKSMLITPAADLATVAERDVVETSIDVTTLPPRAPAEAWAHMAVYGARPDARAIVRAHPPGAFALTATTTSVTPLHGLWQHLRRNGGRTPPGDDQPGPSRGDA